jgi:hypothetical protein
LANGEPLAGLLPAMQSEVPKWDQALGQNREGLATRTAYPSSHPYSFPLLVVSLAEAPFVANDRIAAANGASPRQALKRNCPDRACLSSQAVDNENHGWCEGPSPTVARKAFDPLAGPSPSR